MENYKNFTLGGLYQAGRRMAPPWGSFRRLTNIFKDPTGTFLPYGRGAAVSNAPTIPAGSGATGFTHKGPLSSQYFRKGILQLHCMELAGTYRGLFSYLGPDDTLVQIMQPFKVAGNKNCVELEKHMLYQPSGNYSTCTVARKAYMNAMVNTSEFIATKPVNGFTPEETYLMAFDGIRLRGAGLPLPWTHIDPSGVAGAHYSRVTYVTIGIDGELIFSQYVQQRLSSATRTVYTGGYDSYIGTPRDDCVSNTAGSFPKYRRPEDHLFEELKTPSGFGVSGSNRRYFDKRFLRSFGAATVTNGELSVVCGANYSLGLDVGDWIMVDIEGTLASYGFSTIPATIYMLQIKTLGATTTFEKNIKYLDQNSVTWIDINFEDTWAEWGNIDIAIQDQWIATMSGITFSNLFMIVAYSTTEDSGYVVHDIIPVSWDDDYNVGVRILSSPKVFAVPWAGVVSSLMSDWYDSTVVQTTFPPLKGITNYKDLLVGFDSNALYFPNIALGGSTEMVGGLSNIVPYGSEYGDIVSVCGSEDFLLISRERKNYILTGDIAGSSFNLDECDSAVPGAYNARTVSNSWAGQILFMNAAGIFSVNSSGAIKDISEEIKGLFFSANRDGNLFDKTVFKTLATTRSTGFDGSIFKFFLEDLRGFVVLLTAKASALFSITGSNMLVYNTKENKWYEFEGVASSSAEALNGKVVTLNTDRYTEDGVMRGDEKQLMVTQTMTIDVPSLEKQMCQLKLFGELTPRTSDAVREILVGQISDWQNFDTADRTGWNTNALYTPESYNIYSHKKRLDSSKPQATSIILESTATGSFALEGMEIEGAVIQSGMKK